MRPPSGVMLRGSRKAGLHRAHAGRQMLYAGSGVTERIDTTGPNGCPTSQGVG